MAEVKPAVVVVHAEEVDKLRLVLMNLSKDGITRPVHPVGEVDKKTLIVPDAMEAKKYIVKNVRVAVELPVQNVKVPALSPAELVIPRER